MSWIAAGVAVVGGGIKLYQGYQQKKAGKEAEAAAKRDKPEYEISAEAQANLRDAEQMASQGIASEQRTAAEEDIQRTTQTALMGSADRRGGLGMVSSTAATEQRANLGLLQQDVQARRANMGILMQQRDAMTGYKNQRFEHQYNEYSADMDYARAQIGAGMQNQQSGMNSMMSGAAQGLQGQFGGSSARMAGPDTGGAGAPQMKQGGGFLGARSPMAAARLENPGLSSEGSQGSLIQDMTNTQKRNLFDPYGSTKKSQWNQFGTQGAVGTYQPGVGVGNQIFGGGSDGRENFGFLPKYSE